MIRLILFISILFVFTTSCRNDDKQHFTLTIDHYAGGAGLTVIYKLNEAGLEVKTNCDLANCAEKTVYKRIFTKSESDNIYSFINALELDTLKSSYETKGTADGLFTKLSFKKGLLSSHSSTFDNFNTPTTDTLFKFVDNLILVKKYRFYSWEQD